MSNTFGRLFRITTWGESHGDSLGVVIDGCPAGLQVDLEGVQAAVDARRPGGTALGTARDEPDRVRVLSGVFEGKTLGTPIALEIKNKDARPQDYKALEGVYRPSHADYTYEARFGHRDPRGGGRASARETAARVAAGAIAAQFLKTAYGVSLLAFTESVGPIRIPELPLEAVTPEALENPLRCPDPVSAAAMTELIEKTRVEGDSLGGVVACYAFGLPAGWGAPVFDRLEADLAHAMLSLPATKGFELGSGFAGTHLKGSAHNDPFVLKNGLPTTSKNDSGGVQGGISNGAPLFFRVAFKPLSTIQKPQQTVTQDGQETTLQPPGGRHDPCALPRAVPIVAAMAALVLADHALLARGARV